MRILGRLGILVLVVAAASAMWWLETLREAPEEQPAPPEARHEPDYYMNDFRLRAYEGAGAPRYVLHGERLTHYADDGSAEVTEPRLRYATAEAGAPWHVRGRRGILRPGGDVVDLERDVVLHREPDQRPPITLRTTRMTVFTDAGRAETDRPVTVVSPGQRVDAIGMTAYFGPELIELHQDVRGRYDPAIAP